jgi:hypothetical protein
MLKVAEIHLPTGWTDEHQRLLVKYLRLPRAITRDEWGQALAAFDLLHTGRVRCGRRRLTFQEFYAQTIDAVHATPLIEALLGSADVEGDGSRLLTEHWRQIAAS